MLIFDRFKSREQALAFQRHVEIAFARKTWFCETHEEADEIDLFPFRLYPPIVLVDRWADREEEREIERSVQAFDGRFAGT